MRGTLNDPIGELAITLATKLTKLQNKSKKDRDFLEEGFNIVNVAIAICDVENKRSNFANRPKWANSINKFIEYRDKIKQYLESGNE